MILASNNVNQAVNFLNQACAVLSPDLIQGINAELVALEQDLAHPAPNVDRTAVLARYQACKGRLKTISSALQVIENFSKSLGLRLPALKNGMKNQERLLSRIESQYLTTWEWIESDSNNAATAAVTAALVIFVAAAAIAHCCNSISRSLYRA